MVRDRRRIAEATAAAAMFSGAPSTLHALLSQGGVRAAAVSVRDATRAIGTLVPPSRPGLVRGGAIHLIISALCAEVLARTLPAHRSAAWGAAAGLAIGLVNVGIIGRRFPAIRALPLVPQLADHVAFGTVFALVADRRRSAARS
ncbi:MAG TPA: hypothetical protein VG295_05725 [Solirubrobacteraceae bacterium]|nr:hypothetical protein [Solirubrobacteraceae bacterium]